MSYELVDAVLTIPGRHFGHPGDKLVLAVLAQYANESKECWPSVRALCRLTGLHRTTVHAALNRLEARELLVRIPRRGRSTVYYVAVDGAGGQVAGQDGAEVPAGTPAEPAAQGDAPAPLDLSHKTTPPVAQNYTGCSTALQGVSHSATGGVAQDYTEQVIEQVKEPVSEPVSEQGAPEGAGEDAGKTGGGYFPSKYLSSFASAAAPVAAVSWSPADCAWLGEHGRLSSQLVTRVECATGGKVLPLPVGEGRRVLVLTAPSLPAPVALFPLVDAGAAALTTAGGYPDSMYTAELSACPADVKVKEMAMVKVVDLTASAGGLLGDDEVWVRALQVVLARNPPRARDLMTAVRLYRAHYSKSLALPPTQKQLGQAKQLVTRLGECTNVHAGEVVVTCCRRWPAFSVEAAKVSGTSPPTQPDVGFLLKHAEAALAFYEFSGGYGAGDWATPEDDIGA